jgi:hypothetical protein
VRVPIPVVILLCLCVIGTVWWTGTRKHEFLSPPSQNQLALIREKAGDAKHAKDLPSDLSVPPQTHEATKPIRVPPAPQPQDDAPQLAEYRDHALKDPALLAETARQLETQGKLQRSLLAWERILDSTAPDEARTAEAIQAIKRLRSALPEWNLNPAQTIAITLHAGAGKSTAEILTPALEEISRDLEQASSGILKISAVVTAGRDIPKSRGPAPIALWISGPGATSRSTEVLAFTIGPAEVLRDDVLKTLFKIISSYLGRTASLTVPEVINPDDDPLDSMHSRITRLGWLELGFRLNKTLE